MDEPREIIAKLIGYENDAQHAFALAAADMYILALQNAGWKIVRE